MTAVDVGTQAIVSAVLAEVRQQGKTLLVATHDLHQLAHAFDGALYLQGGRKTPPSEGAFDRLRNGQAT